MVYVMIRRVDSSLLAAGLDPSLDYFHSWHILNCILVILRYCAGNQADARYSSGNSRRPKAGE
jgi:hypothetical protein